jgi:hypothetical protein
VDRKHDHKVGNSAALPGAVNSSEISSNDSDNFHSSASPSTLTSGTSGEESTVENEGGKNLGAGRAVLSGSHALHIDAGHSQVGRPSLSNSKRLSNEAIIGAAAFGAVLTPTVINANSDNEEDLIIVWTFLACIRFPSSLLCGLLCFAPIYFLVVR